MKQQKHRIRIESSGHATKVWVDGVRINCVTALKFEHVLNETPFLQLKVQTTTMPRRDIKMENCYWYTESPDQPQSEQACSMSPSRSLPEQSSPSPKQSEDECIQEKHDRTSSNL